MAIRQNNILAAGAPGLPDVLVCIFQRGAAD